MSLEWYEGKSLKSRSDAPRFTSKLADLTQQLGELNYMINVNYLENACTWISSFKGVLSMPFSKDASGEEYDWFAGLLFEIEDHQVVVVLPWCGEPKENDCERPTLVYADLSIDDEKLNTLIGKTMEAIDNEAIRRRGQY